MKNIKKTALLALMLILCLLMASLISGAAEEYIYKDLTYYIKDGKAYVTGITATADDVVIPAKIGDYEVCVDEFRIADSYNPTSLTFEEGIHMDSYDLWRSGPIKKLSLPSSVIYIDDSRITIIAALEEIEIHKDNKVYTSVDGVLFDKDMTKLICYPSAKEGESYRIPDSVKTVGAQAFYNTKIVNLDLGNGLETIEHSGFNSMKQLKNITFGDSLKTVGIGAFQGCASLESIDLPESVEGYASECFANCTSLKNVTLPKNIKRISASMFSNCIALEKIDFPESVRIIGDRAFSNTGFKELTLPEGIESVGNYAFSECKALTKVHMPKSISDYGYGDTFSDCVNLTEVNFAEGAKVLALSMFGNCTGLKKVTIPSSVEELPSYIFFACKALEEVNLNEGLRCIRGGAFTNCAALKTISLPDSIEKIEGDAFKSCISIEEIDIPDSLTDVYAAAFNNCISLKTINLGEKSKVSGNFNGIGSDKFEGFTVDGKNENYYAEDGVLYSVDKTVLVCYPKAKAGESFEVPVGTKIIGDNAFYSQLFLKAVTLPEGVTEIGADAFGSCKALEKINLPDTVEKIAPQAFSNFKHFEEADGAKYIGKYLIEDVPTAKYCIIRPGTLAIADKAFSTGNVAEIIIPDSVKIIGDGAFYNSELVRVIIPESVTKLGAGAFEYCADLEEAVINAKLEAIPERCFKNCTKLKSVVIPDSVTSIEKSAFAYDKKLKKIYYTGTKEQWNDVKINSENAYAKKAKLYPGYKEDHKHDYMYTVVTAATVKADGTVLKTCPCGEATLETVYQIAAAKVDKEKFTYNGKTNYIPDITVADIKGNKLKIVTDYTVKGDTYPGSPGKHTATITFRGSYAGELKVEYSVLPERVARILVRDVTVDSMTLYWPGVFGATGYRIYQYDHTKKEYVPIKRTTKTSYTVTGLKAGTTYKFAIKTYTAKFDEKILWSSKTCKESFDTALPTPSIKVTSTKVGVATITWADISGESGYQLYYSTSKDGKYKKVKSYKANTVKATKSKLTKGKKYYFKVRAYNKSAGGTVYGSFSAVKSVKIK